MTQQSACPFCKPSIKRNAFDESEHFLAIYNLAPILPGHSMVIPKQHYTGLMDLPQDLFVAMMLFSRQTVRLLSKAFQTEAFDWTVQEKEAAGQTIAHLHIHIIPRKPGDLPEPGDWYPTLQKSEDQYIDSEKRTRLSREQMEKMIAYIRQFKSTDKKD